MEKFNIANLFEIAFGIKEVAVYDTSVNRSEQRSSQFSYKGLQLVEPIAPGSRMSYLGTPIVFPMKFKGKKYQTFNEFGDVDLKSYEDFELPAATLVNFRRSKIITKTNARAANGTIKELYGFNDWSIDIRGLCLLDPSHASAKTAAEQKIKLFEFDKIVDSIRVVGSLFNDLDISHLTIDEINVNQLKGKPGVIPFYLRCSSDEPFELQL